MLQRIQVGVALVWLISQTAMATNVNVLTHHNDNQRTGANLNETVLTTTNVNPSTFGKLFEQPVDGDVFAQPLYVANVLIPGKGRHNVLYVVTMHNTVFAFDADTYSSTPLWKVDKTQLGEPIPVSDLSVQPGPQDISTEIGTLSTPVIDLTTNTLYLLARSKDNVPSYHQKLHALDLRTGLEKFSGPVEVTATYSAGSGTTLTFNPIVQNQRAALLLANGKVYIAWAGHNDSGPYHGWVIAYNAANLLLPPAAFVSTPNGLQGGIWQTGAGPASDASGNVYLETGNGTFDPIHQNYGDSVIKLSSTLTLASFFAPGNQACLNSIDLDLGSAGVLLLPGTSYAAGSGKEGKIYLMNTSNLSPSVDEFRAAPPPFCDPAGACDVSCDWHLYDHIHGAPVYWNSPNKGPLIYVWAEKDYLKAFQFVNTTTPHFAHTPASQSSMTVPSGMPGGFLSLSANGSVPGTGIVWALHPFSWNGSPTDAAASGQRVTGILRAFDASDLSRELWNSQMNAYRDDFGNFAKFNVPTIAAGKVYVPTFSKRIAVYGLLSEANFSFDQALPAADDSGHSYAGSLAGGAAVSSGGISGAAIVLNGSSAYLNTNAGILDTTKSYTVSTWVKLNNTGTFQTMVSQNDAVTNPNISGFYLQARPSGHFSMTMRTADATSAAEVKAESAAAILPNVWYHVAGVYDGLNGTLKLYVNGALHATQSFTSPWPAAGNTIIGRARWAGQDADFVNGRIDETRFFNRALNAVEIEELTAQQLYPSNPHRIHRWSFTGNTQDAVVGANAILGGTPAPTVSATDVVLQNASHQFVTLPIGTDLSLLSNATIEAWVTWNGSQTWARIFDFGSGTTTYMFLTPKNGITGKPRFAATTGGNLAELQSTSGIPFPANVPIHVAVTIDGTHGLSTLYINGLPVNGTPGSAGNAIASFPLVSANLGPLLNVWLGRSQFAADPYFDGSFTEFRIYDVALSPSDILGSYWAGPDSPN